MPATWQLLQQLLPLLGCSGGAPLFRCRRCRFLMFACPQKATSLPAKTRVPLSATHRRRDPPPRYQHARARARLAITAKSRPCPLSRAFAAPCVFSTLLSDRATTRVLPAGHCQPVHLVSLDGGQNKPETRGFDQRCALISRADREMLENLLVVYKRESVHRSLFHRNKFYFAEAKLYIPQANFQVFLLQCVIMQE